MKKAIFENAWRHSLACLTACLLCGGWLRAQSSAPLQGWWQVYLKHKTAKGWAFEADASFRVHSPRLEPSTALGRMGIGRQFKDCLLYAGAAWFETWPRNGSGRGTGELRLYQKLVLTHPVSKLFITHTYRAEERWFLPPGGTFGKMQLRLRYQLQAIYPLPTPTLIHAKPFAIGHSEIFLRPNNGIFSQYRLFGGLGLNWKDVWRLDLGYLAIWLPAQSRRNLKPAQALRTTLTILL